MSCAKKILMLIFFGALTVFAAPPPELVRQMDWLETNFWKFCASERKDELKSKLIRFSLDCRKYRDQVRRKGYRGAVEKPAGNINTELFDSINLRVARLINLEVQPYALTQEVDSSLDYFSYRLALAAVHQQNLQTLEQKYKLNFAAAKPSAKNLERFFMTARNYLSTMHNQQNDFRIQCYLLQQKSAPADWHVLPRYREMKDRDFFELLRFQLALVNLQYEDAGRNQRNDDVQTATFRRNLAVLGYYCAEAKTPKRKRMRFSGDLMNLQKSLVMAFPYFKKEGERFGETLQRMNEIVEEAGTRFSDLPELVIPEMKEEDPKAAAKAPAAAPAGKGGSKKSKKKK